MRARLASGGYTGWTTDIRFACWTPPFTRMGCGRGADGGEESKVGAGATVVLVVVGLSIPRSIEGTVVASEKGAKLSAPSLIGIFHNFLPSLLLRANDHQD